MPDARASIIGIDASRAAIAEQTGTERYSRRIIQELLDLATDGNVRLYVNGNTPIAFRQRANVSQRLIPFPRVWTHLRLSTELARHPVDALFVPSHVVPPIHPRATVVTIHDLGYLHEPQAHTDSSRRYLEWSTRWSVKAARRIIAISEATKQDLVTSCGVAAEKIKVVYHGVDERFRPADQAQIRRVRTWLGIDGPFILYVGTIQPRKNLVRLIEAFEIIADRRPDLTLVLAGKLGWKTDEITAAARNSRHSKRILLPGHVADEMLPSLYSAAEVFTLPSLYEGFGMPVIEAMACGTPCVVSDRGSLSEVAGDVAIVVDPLDVTAIATSIITLLNGEVHSRRVEAGIARASSFSWSNAGEKTMQAICDALHDGS